MFEEEELIRIRSKSYDQKIDELLNLPLVFCKDVIYLIDYHLSTSITSDMSVSLSALKKYIENEPDGYVAEQLILLTLIEVE